jgi:HK97 family phage major capsid protein
MSKENENKDLAQETGKVEDVNIKIDASEFNEALSGFAETLKNLNKPKPEDIPGAPAIGDAAEEKKVKEAYSVRKAILQKGYPDEAGKLDGLELEMHQEAVKEARDSGRTVSGVGIPSLFTRATLQATVDAAGGYSVATELPGFIDTLKNNMATVQAGATLMTGLNGDVSIPKLSANSTAGWRTELGTSVQSDPTFTAVTMTPHRLTTYTVFSQQLLRQSSLDIEAIVRNNLFYSVANALETAALEGDGNSQVPQGILNASVNDATHGSSNPTLASWANIVNMEKMVAVDNALAARMAYVMKATAASKLKTTARDSVGGGYIWEGTLGGGTPVNGYPAYVTNCFTDDSIIFGNWTELMIGQWGGIDLIVNPYAGDIYATVRVVIAGYYDLAVKHAESFARIDDLKL